MNIFNFIKQNLPILNVVQEYTTLKHAGIYWKGLCPFHSEKTPSFTVSPHKDIYYCFGCHAGGDAISFIALLENLSQIAAAKYLIEKYHIKVPQELLAQNEFNEKSHNEKERYFKLCSLVSSWCQENLNSNREAQEYLKKRGFTKTSIEKFSLGYFGGKKDLAKLIKYISKENFLSKDLIDVHIISENKGELYSGFEDRIMFPIRNINGEFIGFGGRIFKEGDDRVKYYNSKENPFFAKGSLLYGLDMAKKSIQKHNNAFLVEGYIDYIAMNQSGAQNCIATLGTACTIEHLKLISRFTEKLIVIYDGDEAGQAAMLRLTELAWNANLEVKIICLPNNEDPASYLFNGGSLKELLRSDQNIYKFFINSTKTNFSSKPLSEKLNDIKKLTTIINRLEDPIKQGILLQDISKEFGIPLEALKKDFIEKKVKYSEHNENKFGDDIEAQIIGAILNDYSLLTTRLFFIKEFMSPSAQEILNNINDSKDFSEAINNLNDEQKNFAIKSFMTFKEKQININDLIEKFQKSNWKKIVALIKEKINQAQKENDFKKVENLVNQFQTLKTKMLM